MDRLAMLTANWLEIRKERCTIYVRQHHPPQILQLLIHTCDGIKVGNNGVTVMLLSKYHSFFYAHVRYPLRVACKARQS